MHPQVSDQIVSATGSGLTLLIHIYLIMPFEESNHNSSSLNTAIPLEVDMTSLESGPIAMSAILAPN